MSLELKRCPNVSMQPSISLLGEQQLLRCAALRTEALPKRIYATFDKFAGGAAVIEVRSLCTATTNACSPFAQRS